MVFLQVSEALGYQCIVIAVLHVLAYLALERNGSKIEPIARQGTSKGPVVSTTANQDDSVAAPALSVRDVEAPK